LIKTEQSWYSNRLKPQEAQSMKEKVTNLVLVGVASICVVSSTVKADTIPVFATYKNTPENTDHIVSVASIALGVPDLMSLLRVEDLDLAPQGSPFSITYLSANTAEVSWNLAGTGTELLGIYIFGGSNGADLYKITNPAEMISGSAIIHPPVTGNSGQFADISHTLFLGAPVTVSVPEPSCILLLASGAAAGLALRKLRRQ
jgi:PEP-CTERM motif